MGEKETEIVTLGNIMLTDKILFHKIKWVWNMRSSIPCSGSFLILLLWLFLLYSAAFWLLPSSLLTFNRRGILVAHLTYVNLVKKIINKLWEMYQSTIHVSWGAGTGRGRIFFLCETPLGILLNIKCLKENKLGDCNWQLFLPRWGFWIQILCIWMTHFCLAPPPPSPALAPA